MLDPPDSRSYSVHTEKPNYRDPSHLESSACSCVSWEFTLILSFSLCLLIFLEYDAFLLWYCVLVLARLDHKRSFPSRASSLFSSLAYTYSFKWCPDFPDPSGCQWQRYAVQYHPRLPSPLSELPQQFMEPLRKTSVKCKTHCVFSFTNNGEIMKLINRIVSLGSGVWPCFSNACLS